MAIIFVRQRWRPTWPWVALGALGLGLGTAAVLGMAPSDAMPAASKPSSMPDATHGCCDSAAKRRASAAPAVRSGEAVQRTSASPTADAQYQEALLYLGCKALAEAEQPVPRGEFDPLDTLDPTGATAARIEERQRRERAACRLIGPSDYRKGEALLAEAARRGQADAQLTLLDRDVCAESERLVAGRSDGNAAPAATAASALFQRTEALAAQGLPDAMLLAAQMLGSGLLVPSDPVRAAAWNLVALQRARGQVLTDDDWLGSGILESLTPEDAKRAMQVAATLGGSDGGPR